MKVYTASKLSRADVWKKLRVLWDDVEFTARWPWFHVGEVPDTPECATKFWIEDEDDIRAADVVLVFGTPEEKLRGALVEAGMGIALGKRIIVVGESPDYGTWQHHPLVSRVPDLDAARVLIKYWSRSHGTAS